MVVKTKFSDNDLKSILANYSLGNLIKQLPFSQGAVQTNILLEATTGKYVFKYYENRTENYAKCEIEILRFLEEKSFPSSVPVKMNDGGFIGMFNNKPYSIFKYIEGKSNQDVELSEIVKMIGRLHQVSENFRPRFSEYRDRYDPALCLANAEKNAMKLESKSVREKRLNWLSGKLEGMQSISDLPKGICHLDCHPTNYLVNNGEVIALIDFDDSNYLPFLYDMASIIYFWAWPHRGVLIFEKVFLILSEYEKYRILQYIEKWHLFDFLKLMIFMSVGWNIHVDEDFEAEKNKIEIFGLFWKRKIFG
ncbi:MAG: homoserine kinase [Caldisericia bacterium]